MSGCGKCCGRCGSCGNAMELSEGEISLLQKLGQIPFLPVAMDTDGQTPIYLEDTDFTQKEYAVILQCLEKRGLISIDYDAPLKGLQSDAYLSYSRCGSFALTQRGQQVLELMEIQGLGN